MYVNGIDIREYGGAIIYRNLSSNRVSSGVKWDYILDRPESYGSGIEFKDVKLDLIFECKTETQFQYNLNKLSEQFRKGAEVRFKDLPYKYMMYSKIKPEYEKIAENHYRVELNLDSDFGVSELKTKTGVTFVNINNSGNYRTPARLSISTSLAHSEMIITGFEHLIKLSNIPKNSNIFIDTISGVIKVNGVNAIDKLTTFHLPYIPVGDVSIGCDAIDSITVQYYERY